MKKRIIIIVSIVVIAACAIYALWNKEKDPAQDTPKSSKNVVHVYSDDETGASRDPENIADNEEIRGLAVETDNNAYDVETSEITGIQIVVDNQTGRKPIETMVTITDKSSNKVIYKHTYENGSYTLDDFKGGPYLVKGVSADGLTEVSNEVVAGNTTTLTLKPFGRISVQFIVKPNKSRFDGFEEHLGSYRALALHDDTIDRFMPWNSIVEDTVTIEDLMPGSYLIEAYPNSEWDQVAWWDQHEQWKGMDKSNFHIASLEVPDLEMGETRHVKLPLFYSGTMQAKVKIPPRLAGKQIDYYIVTEDNTPRETDMWTVGGRKPLGPNGEFTDSDLPRGEFGIYFIASDGSAAFFTGLSVEDEEEKSMTFDLTDARKQSDDGISLEMPNNPIVPASVVEFMNASEEEQTKIIMQALDNGANMSEDEQGELWNKHVEESLKWQKAIMEQEKYQKSQAQKRLAGAADNTDAPSGGDATE